jgi:hypothetical protein
MPARSGLGHNQARVWLHITGAQNMPKIDESLFVDDEQLDHTIEQEKLYVSFLTINPPKPLTIREIIRRIGRICRTNSGLTDNERAFLTDFATAADRGEFIAEFFLRATVEEGEQLKSRDIRMSDIDDGNVAWVGLHRFFGMYVVNYTYEDQNEYGPFTNRKDANAVFSAVRVINTPF